MTTALKTQKPDHSVDSVDSVDWPKLVPFDSTSENLPSIDPSWIPSWAGEFASCLSIETETPTELAAAMVLGVGSAACARCIKVQINETYSEVCNLWLAVALPPGNIKSPIESRSGASLRIYEAEKALSLQPEILARKSDIATQQQRIKSLRQKAATAKKNADYEDFKRQAADAEKEIPEEIKEPRLWTSDVTPERLGTLLADNDECMAWLSAEAGLFDLLQGRYSGGILNLDLFLKAYSGDPERVDRGSRPPVMLNQPRLTMCLTPQPDVLRGLASVKGFRGRGLLGRFLFFVPKSKIGYRHLNAPPVPQHVTAAYNSGIRTMLDWCDGEIRNVSLSEGAKTLWQKYRLDLEPTMRPDGEMFGITDWAAKSAGTAARLATVIHAIECVDNECKPWDQPISQKSMARALNIIEVAKAHAVYAFQLMGSNDRTAIAQKALDWVENKNQRQPFTARAMFGALQRTFNKMSACNEVLIDLCDRGYIRPQVDIEESRGAGRKPSPTFEVRPENA